MDKSHTKEDLSISYISTIAAIAEIDYDTIRHDGDSTDGLLKKWLPLDDGRRYHVSMRVQLKATSSISQYKDDGKVITYQLKAKNYNDLCTPATTPIILGLLILPEAESDWVNWSVNELIIKGCMYWSDLSEEKATSNIGTVSIRINKKQVLNVDSLQYLLGQIAKEVGL